SVSSKTFFTGFPLRDFVGRAGVLSYTRLCRSGQAYLRFGPRLFTRRPRRRLRSPGPSSRLVRVTGDCVALGRVIESGSRPLELAPDYRVFAMRDPFTWSLPLGRLFGITVRVHFLFLVVALGLYLRVAFDDGTKFPAGAAADVLVMLGLLFLSVLLHEFGHCF